MNTTPDDILKTLEAHADLGHARRNQAFLRQVMAVCSSPGTSAPQAASKSAEAGGFADAMSFYRFMGNDKVSLADLRAARAQTVLGSVRPGATLLVVHDVSQLDFSRHNSKADRRPIGDHKGMGYEYVSCVAVDPETATTLGVIHDTVINDDGPDDRDVMDYDYEPLFAGLEGKERQRLYENHRHQMAVHVHGTAELLARWHVIDVADREFDDIFTLACFDREGRDFVIRSSANRNVQMPEYDWLPEAARAKKQAGHPCPAGYVYASLKRVIDHVPLQPYKTLPLDGRNRVVDVGSAKRLAKLSIGSFRVRLYRQAKRNQKYYKPACPVEVNVVVIRELSPAPGCKGLCWVLFTSLPVDTFEAMAFVGRCYELRWSVEEYFRLMKSGYNVLDSRLNSATKLARCLVVVTIAAMAMMNLKRQVDLPSKGALSDEDFQRVKGAMRALTNPEIDLPLRLFALIAKTGGWLGRRRDPIGPTVLMRGLLEVLSILDTAARYGSLIEEALDNPEVLRRLFCV